ncbi:hypothetical protein C1T31_12135 [Hanstruepera neustonica]|uniref:Uncharacterized protein n=1 Tax=Hanstruepera neustonica TaxID=1445657 RepID=A0A2K1DW80_9FLAO|nr:hypothetical protein [Hanstruepera neustonica]PNQ72296.1 hypothetical protein C1T31_12135 [Hanstruepera neustonica]
MRQLIALFLLVLSVVSCDDGDIITVELDFDDTLLTCGELVFYNIKEEPYESLSLKITSPETTLESLIEVDDNGELISTQEVFEINGSTNQFNYRSYSGDPSNLFCNDVPPSNVLITQDMNSTSGTAIIDISLIEDDNDGIPAELEDINGNGDLTDDDTDGDGLPNYIDVDDDGDNVLTSAEIDSDNIDGDDNPLTNPLDTDGDGTPNHLDTDDDDDGVNTIDEENVTQDNNPANDFTDPAIADYLNPDVSSFVAATAYRAHTIRQEFTIEITVDASFPTLNYDSLNFGTLEDSRLTATRLVTPEF